MKFFTKKEIDFLKSNYLQMNNRDMAKALNRRPSSVRKKLLGLGLERDTKTMAALAVKNRIVKDGTVVKRWKHGKEYLQIKAGGTWRNYGGYLWEQHNGPIPKGYRLKYKDGNRLNCKIENLELITEKQNMLLNSRSDDTKAQSLRTTIGKRKAKAQRQQEQHTISERLALGMQPETKYGITIWK